MGTKEQTTFGEYEELSNAALVQAHEMERQTYAREWPDRKVAEAQVYATLALARATWESAL